MSGKLLLNVSSFFILIWGIFDLIVGISFVAGFTFSPMISNALKAGFDLLAFIVFIVAGLFEIYGAKAGFQAAKNSAKAKTCIWISIIVIVTQIIPVLCSDFSKINWLQYGAEFFIPALYFIGACIRLMSKKKEAN